MLYRHQIPCGDVSKHKEISSEKNDFEENEN